MQLGPKFQNRGRGRGLIKNLNFKTGEGGAYEKPEFQNRGRGRLIKKPEFLKGREGFTIKGGAYKVFEVHKVKKSYQSQTKECTQNK